MNAPTRGLQLGLVLTLVSTSISCSLDRLIESLPRLPQAGFDWPASLMTRAVNDEAGALREAWSIDGVFSRQDLAPVMSASGSRVALVGSMDIQTSERLLILKEANGTLEWSKDMGYVSAMLSTDEAIFLGSPGRVEAVSPEDGAQLWSTYLLGSRSPREIHLNNGNLNVNTSRQVFFILDAVSGQILQRRETEIGTELFLQTGSTTFSQAPTPDSLQAISTVDSHVLWTATFSDTYYLSPVFGKGTIFIRTGRDVGNVIAVDASSGNVQWEWAGSPAVSNVVLLDNLVAFLTADGGVIAVDAASGSPTYSATFSPGPFVLLDNEFHPRGFVLAGDQASGSLYALLGDSRQLFAFELHPNY